MEAIIVAIITSGLGLIGIIVSNVMSNRDMKNTVANSLDKHQAVQDTKIEELTREVRMHNDFAKRIPVIENKIENIEKRVTNIENK